MRHPLLLEAWQAGTTAAIGAVGDFAGPAWGTMSAAAAALLVCPLALLLGPRLSAS